MPVLAIKQGYNQGATYRLGQRTLTLGRDPANLVQIVDERASRRHAVIRWTGTGYRIQDLESRNGLFVNDQAVTAQDLAVGDRIRVGGTLLEVGPDRQMRENSFRSSRPVVDGRAFHTTEVVALSDLDEAVRRAQVPFPPAQPALQAFDVDHAWQQRANRVEDFLADLDRLVKSRTPLKACLDHVLSGVLRFLAPDRAYVFGDAGSGKLRALATVFTPGLGSDRAHARPHLQAIAVAWHRHRPFILNSLESLPDPGGRLGSVAVLPVAGQGDQPRAVLYLDSFAENPQAFVEDDFEFLRHVATALGPLLERS